jgi:hypothetical protein
MTRDTISGDLQTVLQGAVDAIDSRIDDLLVRVSTLETVLYAALNQMQRADLLDDSWPKLLSEIAGRHRANAANAEEFRQGDLLSRVADGMERYSTIAEEEAFDLPSLN